jgi:hypothetical protein
MFCPEYNRGLLVGQIAQTLEAAGASSQTGRPVVFLTLKSGLEILFLWNTNLWGILVDFKGAEERTGSNEQIISLL